MSIIVSQEVGYLYFMTLSSSPSSSHYLSWQRIHHNLVNYNVYFWWSCFSQKFYRFSPFSKGKIEKMDVMLLSYFHFYLGKHFCHFGYIHYISHREWEQEKKGAKSSECKSVIRLEIIAFAA